MISGGVLGFGIGVLSGVVTEGSTWPVILLRASIGALAAGVLLRWWGHVWAQCWNQAQAERQAAREKTPTASLSPFPK